MFHLILQLLCNPIGNRNFRKKTKQNIAIEGRHCGRHINMEGIDHT